MKDPRAPNMPWVSLYLVVADMQRSIEFYKKAFGFEVQEQIPDEKGNLIHVSMRYKNECSVMFCPKGHYGQPSKTPKEEGKPSASSFYVYFDDADTTYKNAVEAGAESLEKPQDSFWGDRFAAVIDPDGYKWSIATHSGVFANQ